MLNKRLNQVCLARWNNNLYMRKLKLIGLNEIVLDGHTVKYHLKKSYRARHMRLEVRLESGLSVIVPRRYDMLTVKRFLELKSRWILGKLEECELLQSRLDKPAFENINYLGRTLKLVRLQGNQEYAQVSFARDRIIISANNTARTGQLLKEWYLREAKELITRKIIVFSKQVGVKYNKVTVKTVRTRWGSCSRLGNLSFNWKLITVPEEVVDYVIIHELCHLKRMDHSSAFWRLVHKYSPDYNAHRKWLKAHEPEINSLLE